MFKSLGMISSVSFKSKLFTDKEYVVCHPNNISRSVLWKLFWYLCLMHLLFHHRELCAKKHSTKLVMLITLGREDCTM